MHEPYIQLDRERLKDVVHFVVSRCRADELGNVKLHKILYFADMLHFMAHGQPLTGVDYIKQNFGPTARHLSWAVDELSKEGRLKVEDREYYGFLKRDYISLEEPASVRLSKPQQALLQDVIEFVCNKSAKEISELSHDAAWHAAELGERIPYAAAFGLQAAEVTQGDVDSAVEELRRIRPVIEAGAGAGQIF